MSAFKKTIFYFVFFSLFLSVFCVIGEIAIRVIKPQQTYSDLLELVNDMWAPSDYHKYELKKNYTGKYPSNEIPAKYITVQTNNFGLRDDHDITYDNPEDKKRILIIGDSFTFGQYVETVVAYPHKLEHMLEKLDPRYEVINAGFPGFEADDVYVWLRKEGVKFKPDVIIYGFYIGNDLNVNRKQWILDKHGLPVRVNKNIKLPKMVDEFGRIRENIKFAMAGDTAGYEYIYKIPLLRESHFFVAVGRLTEKIYNYFYSKIYASGAHEIAPGFSVAMFPQIFGEDDIDTERNIKRFMKQGKNFSPHLKSEKSFLKSLF